MNKNSFVLIFCLLLSFYNYSQASASHLEVTGRSAAEEVPQDLVISIPIVVLDSSYISCSKALNALLSDLKSDLISRGFNSEELNTGDYSITENFEFRQGERVKMGYKGQVTLSLRQKYEPVLIDRFLRASEKFKIQYTVRFMLSEAQKEKLSKESLVLAVEDAKKKARTLAEAAGVGLGALVKISYGEELGRPGPLMEVRAMDAGAAQGDANGLRLHPGEVSVNQSVFMVWEIER